MLQMYQRLINHFGHTRWYSYVMKLKWKLGSVCLEIVLILMKDTYTVHAKHTTVSEFVLDTHEGTAR